MGHKDEAAVRDVVQKYIEGTFTGDVKVLRDCFHPNAVMNGYLGDQLIVGDPEPFFENMEQAPSMAEGRAPYQGNVTSVEVVGNVASVTLKETGFGGDMAFTDYFHLLKEQGEWKIISKTFTTE